MKKICLFIILLIFTCSLQHLKAQTPDIDSLKMVLQKHVEKDTLYIDIMNDLIKKLLYVNSSSTLEYAQEGIALADKLNYKKGKAKTLKLIGLYYSHKSDYDQALKYYNEALKLNKEIENKKGISNCLNNIGIVYSRLNNYSKTLEYYQKSMKIDEELKDSLGVAISLKNIGSIYRILGDSTRSIENYRKSLAIFQKREDKKRIARSYLSLGYVYKDFGKYDKALEYFKKSLKINEEIGDKKGISNALNSIGDAFYLLGDYSKSMDYYQKSIKFYKEIGDEYGVALSLTNIGQIYQNRQKFPEALNYYQKALTLMKEIDNKFGVSESYLRIGEIYLLMQKFDKAESFTKRALKLAKGLKVLEQQRETYKQLSSIYASAKDYKNAYENYIEYKKLSDSIFNENNIKEATKLELQYKYEKEKQASLLEQEKKEIALKAEIEKQKNIRNLFVGSLFAVILIAFLIFSSLRINKKAKSSAQDAKISKEQNQKLLKLISGVKKISFDIFQASNQLSKASQEISERANEQASTTEEIASSMEQMMTIINLNTQNAEDTADISKKSAEELRESNKAFVETIKAVSDISKKTLIITDISFQTNILSINASIEAARAGKAGKGFAVVAQEVRKLAEKSKLASDEITELSQNGNDISKVAGEKLEILIPEIIKSAELVNNIVTASKEQQSGAENINISIQQLTEIANENSASAEEMSASAEELLAQAEHLKELISMFKTDNSQNEN